MGHLQVSVGDEVKSLQRTEDGVVFEDGLLELSDGREMAWRWWGDPDGKPVFRIQGTPSSRLQRNPDASVQRNLGVRFLMADRPGYGGSTRKPGRGIADIADDYAQLLDAHGLDRVPAMGTSGGGPHVLALAARHPDRVPAATVVVGGTPLQGDEVARLVGVNARGYALAEEHPDRVPAATVVVGGTPLQGDEVARLVGVNARGYALAEEGWEPLHEFLVEIRERLVGDEGMQGVLSDAPASDRAIMTDPLWQRMSRENIAETLRQGAEGWTDESLAMHREWDFDPADVKSSVTWWHGDDDMNAPLSAARRIVARLPGVDLRVWHDEGHFASLIHDREIVAELLSRSS
ncbi:MAG: alpha/beta hydrolase [Chloroflexi bacterium]|nr:MAG: alpha/beta hydrolase [Chloroflexota bacterium]